LAVVVADLAAAIEDLLLLHLVSGTPPPTTDAVPPATTTVKTIHIVKCVSRLGKIGHTTTMCWYRFDENYVLEQHVAAMASGYTSIDPNWYLDSGATDHITGKLEKLTMNEHYTRHDQIRAANGTGMKITHVGKSILPNPHCPLHLNHILHVPNAHKQLVSIPCFNLDNNAFIELHLFFFLIKDQITRKILVHGHVEAVFIPCLLFISHTEAHIICNKAFISTMALSTWSSCH
jgi:hypothetical protein